MPRKHPAPAVGSGDRRTIEFRATACALALQKDGKIVLAGISNNDFAIARLTPSGA